MNQARLAAVKAIAAISRILDLPVYAVGGTVRDILLERESRDIDLLVFGDVFKAAAQLSLSVEGSWFVLDELQRHVRVLSHSLPGLTIDLAESKTQTLGENLKERDFTINAIALEVSDYQQYLSTNNIEWVKKRLVDPCQGQPDIDAKLVRLNNPRVFASDPVRLLRAPRLAGKLGFALESRTRKAIVDNSYRLSRTTPERIRDEFFHIFNLDGCAGIIEELRDLGLLAVVLPELTATWGVGQNVHHALDVWGHSITALRRLETRPWMELNLDTEVRGHLQAHLDRAMVEGRSLWQLLKMAALLHDIGKPLVREARPEGKVTFYRHEQVGGKMVTAIADRMKLSRREERFLNAVVTNHLRPLHLFLAENHTEKAEYRFFKQLNDDAVSILLLSLADRSAGKSEEETAEIKDFFRFAKRLIDKYYREYKTSIGSRLIGGKDLIEVFGLSPGPQFSKILDWVEEAQLEKRVTTREEAIDLVKHILQSAGLDQPTKRG